jgi:Ca2+-binding RTX toxin-like protein
MAKITGTSAANRLIGTRTSDTIYGKAGDDWIEGGDGNDVLLGGAGIDRIFGGAGNDTIYGDLDGATVANSGGDFLYGDAGDDFIGGQAGNDFLSGGSGNDNLFGDEGDDSVAGGSGRDMFNDFWGRDIQYGGEWGGTGDGARDTFDYDFAGGSNLEKGVDFLADFESGIDVIDFAGFDADSTTMVNQPRSGPVTGLEKFTVVQEASGQAGQMTLTYDPLTGITTLRAYINYDMEADFSLEIAGTVNPHTDLVGVIVPAI